MGSRNQAPEPPGTAFSERERQAAAVLISSGLQEDAPAGDLTSEILVAESVSLRAAVVPRQDGILCGLPVVAELFRQVEPAISLRPLRSDGDRVAAGAPVLELDGPAQPVLRGERVALNFLQRLSGIATATRRIVDAVAGTGCRVYDTRKTIPGWRVLERYAVRVGGGFNHRFSLSDLVIVKDNHRQVLAALGEDSMEAWVRRVRETRPGVAVELEVDSIDELESALRAGADIVLLDNFGVEELRRAVELTRGMARKPLLEASGGITAANAAEVAATGVDRMALGAITHSAPALDLGLDVLEIGQ